jgi:hypothetical protein
MIHAVVLQADTVARRTAASTTIHVVLPQTVSMSVHHRPTIASTMIHVVLLQATVTMTALSSATRIGHVGEDNTNHKHEDVQRVVKHACDVETVYAQ